MITYSKDLTPKEYNSLRAAVHFGDLSERQATEGLRNTQFLLCAREEGRAVAMGRILFDYGYTAFLADIIVLPEYQGKGIGAHIVSELMDEVMNTIEKGEFVMFNLNAAMDKEGFYEKFGFERRPNEHSGSGMSRVIRK